MGFRQKKYGSCNTFVGDISAFLVFSVTAPLLHCRVVYHAGEVGRVFAYKILLPSVLLRR